jgi:hypothetical protein
MSGTVADISSEPLPRPCDASWSSMLAALAPSKEEETLTVNTAHPGLARSLGDALHHAYGGELDYHYPEEGGVLRVRWSR